MGGADVVEDERELLDRRDDDLLAALDELAEVTGVLGVADGRRDLGELLDGRVDLSVEDPPVGDDDDRIEDRRAVALELDETMGEPGDRVRLAAAGGVLDQVAAARAVPASVGQELADDIQLVEAREDLRLALAVAARVLSHEQRGVVLDDLGEAVAAEHLSPEVVGLDAVGIGRVAGTALVALVEGQEPGLASVELGAEADLGVVNCEVGEGAPEAEDQLLRAAVPAVLLDRVLDRLLGEAVLELERGDRQAVDEEAEVEGELRLIAAVAELAGNDEAVCGIPLGGGDVAW